MIGSAIVVGIGIAEEYCCSGDMGFEFGSAGCGLVSGNNAEGKRNVQTKHILHERNPSISGTDLAFKLLITGTNHMHKLSGSDGRRYPGA
jgi:hypothetical protein